MIRRISRPKTKIVYANGDSISEWQRCDLKRDEILTAHPSGKHMIVEKIELPRSEDGRDGD